MSDTTKKLDDAAYSLKLPLRLYKVRVIEAKMGNSSTGNPMITGNVEIFGADPINGIDINGLTITFRSVIVPTAIRFVNITRSALDLPSVTVDTLGEVSAEEYIKCEGFAKCTGKSVDQTDEVTGEPMVDPYTGEKLVRTTREILEWIPRPSKK